MNSTKDLQNGDILICTADRFIPKLIKFFTKSEYNHAAIFTRPFDKDGIIEAQTDGINWKPLKYWVDKYQYKFIVYRCLAYNNEYRKEIARRAFEKCGNTGYDFESFIIRQPLNIVHGIWKQKEEEDKRMICSEFVGWVYEFKGWEKMTPKDLKRELDRSPRFKKIGVFK